MKRYALVTISVSSFLALAAASLPASAAIRGSLGTPKAAAEKYFREPLCQSYKSMCVDTYSHQKGEYVGHDEPSVLFKSRVPGSGTT